MWTKIEQNLKPIEEVGKREIWSINAKAKKFVLSSIDPKGLIFVKDCGSGKELNMPYDEYKGKNVCVWGSEKGELISDFDVFDRVQLNGTDRKGIIVDINDTKFPDMDICVLWDEMLHQQWITENHPHEISCISESIDEPNMVRAKEARAIVKDMQKEQDHKYEDKARKVVQDELSKQLASREEYRKTIGEGRKREAFNLAKQTLNKHAMDFKFMIESGMLSITAGEEEGEIHKIPEIVNSHLESIYSKVSAFTDDDQLKLAATVEATKIMTDTMLKEYFLTRNSYIQRKGSGWGLFNKKGTLLGTHENKKGAVRQLHATEWHMRRGLDNVN
jgi:hypothetical protein